jgi:hypothetical protein
MTTKFGIGSRNFVQKDTKVLKAEAAERKAEALRFRKILKKEIYGEMMKPYFKAGNNYKEFITIWFDETVEDHQVLKIEKTFFEKYLLIKTDSRNYIIFKIFSMITACLAFVFVPYYTFVNNCDLSGSWKSIVLALDMFWILHVLLQFMFAYKRDSI